MKIILSFFCCCVILTQECKAQITHNLTWNILEQITFQDLYVDSLDSWFWQPVFTDTLLHLEGRRVKIKGYVNSLDTLTNSFWLDRRINTQHGCIVDDDSMLSIDIDNCQNADNLIRRQEVTVEGILILNSNDVRRLSFIFDKPTLIHD